MIQTRRGTHNLVALVSAVPPPTSASYHRVNARANNPADATRRRAPLRSPPKWNAGVSVFFEIAKETIEEEVSPELKPMLASLFGELTVLGFIGIVLFFTFKLQIIQDLNETLYDEENAINEMSETVHMALFLVMIIFLGTDLLLIRAGSFVEAGWRKQRENLFNVEMTNTSKLILRERRNHTTMWDKIKEGNAGHVEVEQAIFA